MAEPQENSITPGLLEVKSFPVSQLIPADYNPRVDLQPGDEEYERLKASMETFGYLEPIVWNQRSGHVVGGHQRLKVLVQEGATEVSVVVVDMDPRLERQANLALNKIGGDWDDYKLKTLLAQLQAEDPTDMHLTGFGTDELDKLLEELRLEQEGAGSGGTGPDKEAARKSLTERFGVPPFSVLDARQGYWQDRKRAWMALGIASDAGREGMRNKTGESLSGSVPGYYKLKEKVEKELGHKISNPEFEEKHLWTLYDPEKSQLALTEHGGILSIFDPVLCELSYRWFCPPGGQVLDPFAGGSVRGAVAALLGYRYTGVDLSEKQVEANRAQWPTIDPQGKAKAAPVWVNGDSRNITDLAPGQYDLIFSCPPYGDLEQYTDNPDDLSNCDHQKFVEDYRTIIANACSMLKPNRLACFVVGDFRDEDGNYRNFVADTIDAFLRAGLKLYNEAVLVTALGSAPMRAGRQFQAKRKLAKSHQNVLVFIKGNADKLAEEYGPGECGEIPDANGADPTS